MLNQVSLMGRLTADPELRHTPNDVAVTTFTIAVNRSYVKQGSERQADFIDVVAWRNTAEFVCRYFRKGQMIAVTGSIQTRTYQDREGKNRKAVEVVADNVYFTESRNNSSGNTSTGNSGYNSEQSDDQDKNTSYSSGSVDDFTVIANDEDLPF
ncbi:MAG: single-stranded DNA-binding protein [Oscillospiraceae bacterium]|nr:single-stranded DNA-binding protein [Oscillospiraceae bacterium]